MRAPSVLFVCARNAVRSPMAQALWLDRFGPDGVAHSCGIDPAAWPDGFMISVMDEIGHDLSDFACRDIQEAADDPVELVICLAEEAHGAASAFAERRGADYALWPIGDPTRAQGRRDVQLGAYRAARDAVAAHINSFGQTD